MRISMPSTLASAGRRKEGTAERGFYVGSDPARRWRRIDLRDLRQLTAGDAALQQACDAALARLGRRGFTVLAGPGVRRRHRERRAERAREEISVDRMVLEQRRKDAEDAQRQSDEGRDFLAEGQSRTHSQQL